MSKCDNYLLTQRDINELSSFLDDVLKYKTIFFREDYNDIGIEDLIYPIDSTLDIGNTKYTEKKILNQIKSENFIMSSMECRFNGVNPHYISKYYFPVLFDKEYGEVLAFNNRENTSEKVVYYISRKPYLRENVINEIKRFKVFLKEKSNEEILNHGLSDTLDIHYINSIFYFELVKYPEKYTIKESSIRLINTPSIEHSIKFTFIIEEINSSSNKKRVIGVINKTQNTSYVVIKDNIYDFDIHIISDEDIVYKTNVHVTFHTLTNTEDTIVRLHSSQIDIRFSCTTYFQGYFQNRISHTLLKYNFVNPTLHFLVSYKIQHILKKNAKCSIKDTLYDIFSNKKYIPKVMRLDVSSGHRDQSIYLLYGYLMEYESLYDIPYLNEDDKKCIAHKMYIFFKNKDNLDNLKKL